MTRMTRMMLTVAACVVILTTTVDSLALPSRREHLSVSSSVAAMAVAAASGWMIPTAGNAEVVSGFNDKTLMKIGQVFPGALSNAELLRRVHDGLTKKGYTRETTLVASSFCSDEVNRPLEDTFRNFYGNRYFAMGGLAGFPFSGVTGFAAMASHIPDGGNCILIYGPHVGVNSDGKVGTVNRIGQKTSGTCCGSAVAATKYLGAVLSGDSDVLAPPTSSLDAQQTYVGNALLPYASFIQESKDPMVTLPYQTYKPIDNMMRQILAKVSSKVGTGRIALVGGLQINTPDGMSDYFLPLRFETREASNEVVQDMIDLL